MAPPDCSPPTLSLLTYVKKHFGHEGFSTFTSLGGLFGRFFFDVFAPGGGVPPPPKMAIFGTFGFFVFFGVF